MLKSKLEKFIFRRLVIFSLFLTILDVLFIDEKLLAFGGLAAGSAFSLVRLGTTASMLSGVITPGRTGMPPAVGVLKYIFSQIATMLLLAVSLKVGIWFFCGMTAGILLVPFAIFINGITEGLGITHNNFE